MVLLVQPACWGVASTVRATSTREVSLSLWNMGFDCLGAQERSRRDLGIRVAGHDEVGDLPLRPGQRRQPVTAGLSGNGSVVDVTAQPSQVQLVARHAAGDPLRCRGRVEQRHIAQ
jgi:hypothetical protein